MSAPVLLVEDDISIAVVITTALEDEGLQVVRCDTIAERDRLLNCEHYSALITDVVLKDGDGIETLPAVKDRQPDIPVIVVSAQNTLDTAVRASDTGAFEYFPKPFDLDELIRAVTAAIAASEPEIHPAEGEEHTELPLVGRSNPMQAVYRMITRVLRNDLTVLILGESGTGKELVAEAIHKLGQRSQGPFVAVNTAAIPADLIESELFGHEKGAFTGAFARHIGKFEQARGGTLFLDEIGDMPMQAQTRLLRALQSGSILRVGGREEVPIDARIIAATNKDLAPLIEEGRFREDLYYRLNVVPIMLPPLRERGEDIDALARHFLAKASREGLPRRALTDDAAALLRAQPWRGNVRELRNFIYRLALLAREDLIDRASVQSMLAEEIPTPAPSLGSPTPPFSGASDLETALARWLAANAPEPGQIYAKAIAAFERPLLTHMLDTTGGNQLRAARMLGINRNTLRKRLDELDIDPERFAARTRS
ncbi:sigma-54-dependent transcriptional regulator [Croceicoccus mobilis]|uniref:DNA-binding transcriptional regulator NtrC n=1 Tax=Croceicoccus mobilis TaxID=1703339 RepID=A0A916Z4G0_9SPHN|nr:sigma-54 dependent transcriptional regulator [Croceicoccus mobilis]GGD75662.1 nitrogen assimilation regulatory protein [Croceicoccus mobilis]